MLQPKRTKFRKSHRGRRNGLATKGVSLNFGDYGIRALEAVWLTARQIEAARRTITHHLKRGGQVWIRVFPDKAVTSKPLETRQGSGKGAVDHWVAVVKRGVVLFEVAGVDEEIAKEALWLACRKLPIPTKVISRFASSDSISGSDGTDNEN